MSDPVGATGTARASRAAILRAADRLGRGADLDDTGVDPATALVVASAPLHLDVVRARAGELKRSEVWVSPAGVVAVAHQQDDEVEGALVSLPPVAAHQVCASALALGRDVGPAPAPRAVAEGFAALARAVIDGSQPDSTLTVADWRHDDVLTRWVVLDSDEGRVVDLDAPHDEDASLTLAPIGAVGLAVAASRIVAAASAPTADDGPT